MSLGPTASMSSTCTPMQMSSSVFTNKTRIVLILNETVFFQVARQVFLPTSRRCSKTQQGLAHFPHHTSAIHQNLRVPTFRWLCMQLFAFADFSVEESLCVLGHKSFVSQITFVETPCQQRADALYCCCLRHGEALRNLSQCTWISTLLEFSSCPPSGQT